MAFFLPYSDRGTDFKDCISFENPTGPVFCHLHFQEKTSFLWYPRGKDKRVRIKSLLDLFTKIVWHTGNTVETDVYNIYESLLSKYGFTLLKEEFPNEKFNTELIDNVDKEINFLIAEVMEQIPID